MRSSRGLTKRTERPGHPGRSRFGSLLLVDHRLSDLRHLATNEPSVNVYLDGETTLYTIYPSIIFLALGIGALVISYLQFKEKGYLFNNAYIWASKQERKQMDVNKESKTPYYRQSGFAFIFIGFIFLAYAVYIATDWMWMYVAFGTLVLITVSYAVVSSIQNERHK